MIKKLIPTPIQKFVQLESFSGILLIFATIVALVWANSPFGESYDQLLQYEIGVVTQSFGFSLPSILWINDGLMAIFFFLIGLEIKRELVIGRRAKGYVALYRYVEPIDTVFVLAIRSQREAGYTNDERR